MINSEEAKLTGYSFTVILSCIEEALTRYMFHLENVFDREYKLLCCLAAEKEGL